MESNDEDMLNFKNDPKISKLLEKEGTSLFVNQPKKKSFSLLSYINSIKDASDKSALSW